MKAGMEPGGSSWKTMMSASKVAIVLGVAPESWGGKRKLWNIMTGRDPGEPQTAEMSRGHYLEDGIRRWFYDQNPDLTPLDAPTMYSERLPWACATPDGRAQIQGSDRKVFIEVKTVDEPEKWGKPGTDQIPSYYLAQTIWQQHMTEGEVDETYLPVLMPYLSFAQYVVRYDRELALAIEAKCLAFMEAVWSDTPPELDSTVATYESLRRVHPDIQDTEVELPPIVAWEFLTSKQAVNDATSRYNLARSTVADLMTTARTGVCAGQTIAIRQARGEGKPFVTEPRRKPALDLIPLENNAA